MSDCEEHPERTEYVECVNCGNPHCAACAAEGAGNVTKCDRCDDYVCTPAECDTSRGEGPSGCAPCYFCAAGCCLGCLTLIDTPAELDGDAYVCSTCELICEACTHVCTECYEQAYCCECGGPLIGPNDKRDELSDPKE